MKYTIYEDPLTQRFAFVQLPNGFVDGDALPVVTIDRWFGSREEAMAALPELLNREDSGEPDSHSERTMPPDGGAPRAKYPHH